MPDESQFNVDRSHPSRWTITFNNPPINMFVPTTIDELRAYGWVNRALDDHDLDSFVDTLVHGLVSFDCETLSAAKAQINRFGTPTTAELQSSNELLFPLLALPGAQARRAKIRSIGYGIRSDFELNFGRYLPSFGPAEAFKEES